jgi:hypothetical protein
MISNTTLLIHGYGVRATYPLIRPQADKNLGFGAFEELIATGKAQLFVWGKETNYSLLDTINPFKYLQLYKEEKIIASAKSLLQSLHNYIQTHNISTIVTHSMGGYLLQQYLGMFDLPSSVTTIIIVQADIARNAQFNIPQNVQGSNLFCPWDQALWESVVVNRYIPAGLFGANSKNIKNIFFPLYKDINLHESSIKDTNILRLLP